MMEASPTTPYLGIDPTFPALAPDKPNKSSRQCVESAFGHLRTGWEYVNKTLTPIRHTVTAISEHIAETAKEGAKAVKKAAPVLKVLGVAGKVLKVASFGPGAFFAFINGICATKDAYRAGKCGDNEGAVLNGAGATIEFADCSYSIFALVELGLGKCAPLVFTPIGIAAGIGISGLAGIVSAFGAGQSAHEWHKIKKYNPEHQNYEKLQDYLNDEALKSDTEKTTNKLGRRFSGDIATQMKTAKDLLNRTEISVNDKNAIAQAVYNNARKVALRKTCMNIISFLAHTAAIVGLILILVAAGPAFLPFAIIAITAAVRLGVYVYENHWLEKGLDKHDRLDYPPETKTLPPAPQELLV